MSAEAAALQAENDELRARRARLLAECEGLEAERDRYRDLYEFAPDMYGLLDVDTATILECNQAMVRILGRERHEIIGKHFFEFHPSDSHEALRALVERFRETGESPDAEIEFLRADGTRAPASSRVSTIRDEQGRIVRARSVMRDITAQKQMESALAESEERFHRLAETIDMVPWEAQFDLTAQHTDGTGGAAGAASDEQFDELVTLTHIGPQCENVLGYTPEQAREPGFWIKIVHADDRAMVRAKVADLLGCGDMDSIEYRVTGGDGRTIWVFNQCHVVHRQRGPASVVGIAIDITDRKEASERRRRVMRELDHRVKNALAVVGTVADRTSETTRSYGEFATLLTSRVHALARIHAALSTPRRQELMIEALLDAAVGADPRFRAAGPSLSLPLKLAQPLGMALKELAINARSHGALSVPAGHVTIEWRLEIRDSKRVLVLEWSERDGPPACIPTSRGYGLYLIQDTLKYEVDAEVDMSFPPSGMDCTIAIPIG